MTIKDNEGGLPWLECRILDEVWKVRKAGVQGKARSWRAFLPSKEVWFYPKSNGKTQKSVFSEVIGYDLFMGNMLAAM